MRATLFEDGPADPNPSHDPLAPPEGRAGAGRERLVDSVARVGDVLRLFTRDWPERHVSEVARLIGVSKSTAHSLLTTMTSVGLLRRSPNGGYRLGWQLLSLGGLLKESTDFRVAAAPVMKWLVDRYGETVHLATIEDGQCIYVDKVEGTRAIRIAVSYLGARLPLHCSGVGKVLLAHKPLDAVKGIVSARGLDRRTGNTITTWEELEIELHQVRERGVAFDLEETLPELSCVAAPIRDYTGEVVAAVSISAPTYRLKGHREQYRQAVVAAGRRASEELGYGAVTP